MGFVYSPPPNTGPAQNPLPNSIVIRDVQIGNDIMFVTGSIDYTWGGAPVGLGTTYYIRDGFFACCRLDKLNDLSAWHMNITRGIQRHLDGQGYLVEEWEYVGTPFPAEYDPNPPYLQLTDQWKWKRSTSKSELPQPSEDDVLYAIAKPGWKATGLNPPQEFIVKKTLSPLTWDKYRLTTATGFAKIGCLDNTAMIMTESLILWMIHLPTTTMMELKMPKTLMTMAME